MLVARYPLACCFVIAVNRRGRMWQRRTAQRSSPPVTPGLRVGGDVLILGIGEQTPHGALFEVESVDEQGAGLVLLTRPAALGAAFEQLQVELAVTLADPSTRPARSRCG